MDKLWNYKKDCRESVYSHLAEKQLIAETRHFLTHTDGIRQLIAERPSNSRLRMDSRLAGHARALNSDYFVIDLQGFPVIRLLFIYVESFN